MSTFAKAIILIRIHLPSESGFLYPSSFIIERCSPEFVTRTTPNQMGRNPYNLLYRDGIALGRGWKSYPSRVSVVWPLSCETVWPSQLEKAYIDRIIPFVVSQGPTSCKYMLLVRPNLSNGRTGRKKTVFLQATTIYQQHFHCYQRFRVSKKKRATAVQRVHQWCEK